MAPGRQSFGLTKKEYTGGAPLSQVGGRKLRQKSVGKEGKSQSQSQSQKPEPDTDDEPLSSSEEEEQIQNEEEKGNQRRHDDSTYEAKEEVVTKRKRNGRSGQKPNATTNARSKKAKDPVSDDDGSLFFGMRGSQERSSQKKVMRYSKTRNYGSSQDEFKKPREIKKRKQESPPPFRHPIDVKIRTPRKKTTTNIHASEAKPKFRMPAVESTFENLVLPAPKFREPQEQFTSSFPSSGLTSGELDFDIDDDSSTLSSPLSDVSLLLAELDAHGDYCDDDDDDDKELSLSLEKSPGTDRSGPSLCPNCYAPVDPDLLGEYLVLPGRRLKDDRSFCERHKTYNAEKEWADNGYPTINWDTFDRRLKRHSSELEQLFVSNPSNFFRGQLENAMKSGQAKVFKLSLEEDNIGNGSCGYYGPKGASRMLNFVTSKYSHKLRHLAAMDTVLKTAGPTAYAQAVLVPELTVLLIKEDMKVDSEKARQILRESTDIGHRLNAAEDDQIRFDVNVRKVDDNGYT